jgi:acyl dehydratase
MNDIPCNFTLNSIKIGQKKNFSEIITKSLIDDFAKISGDYNPLHMDDEYASNTIFEKRVCHGMLLSSFFSKLIGMYLPGKNALYFSQSLQFKSPCFIDDEIFVEGEVLEKSNSTRIITVKTTIHKNSGECLVDGQAKVIVREQVA